MIPFFYKTPILPKGFSFPETYEAMILDGSWPDVEPWVPLAMDMPSSLTYYGAMLLKFKQSPLVPFAIIKDEDGFYNDGYIVLACFDGADLSGNPKIRIYDYGKPMMTPWKNKSYSDFDEWIEGFAMFWTLFTVIFSWQIE